MSAADAVVVVPRELLEEVADWLRSNPPADGWGCLDRGADNERKDLLSKIRRVLDADAEPVRIIEALLSLPDGVDARVGDRSSILVAAAHDFIAKARNP